MPHLVCYRDPGPAYCQGEELGPAGSSCRGLAQKVALPPGEWEPVYQMQVKNDLRERHSKSCTEDAIAVGLWGGHVPAAVWPIPRSKCKDPAWSCRGCNRKGGLGARMFKAHGREATYRCCVAGACGKQFWATERFCTHLRDSASCVNILRGQGKVAAATLPGKGSKEHRTDAGGPDPHECQQPCDMARDADGCLQSCL